MLNEKDRILSYKLATILERDDLEKVAGGSSSGTMRTQKIRSTKGGDSTVDLDGFDFE